MWECRQESRFGLEQEERRTQMMWVSCVGKFGKSRNEVWYGPCPPASPLGSVLYTPREEPRPFWWRIQKVLWGEMEF